MIKAGKKYLAWAAGAAGLSGLLGGNAFGLFKELVLGGKGFLGGIAGTDGLPSSMDFWSLSGFSSEM